MQINWKGLSAFYLVVWALATLVFPDPAGAQPQANPKCPPACGLNTTVPADESRAPEINIETLSVSPGAEIDFGTNKRVLIRFEGGQSPFVNRNGNPIKTLTIIPGRPQRFSVREQGDDCKQPPGCKYSVMALPPGGRPILDPYMIIE